jgi:hypothetical protein
MTKRKRSLNIGGLLLASTIALNAAGISVTQTGTFAADNSVDTYNFSVSATQTYWIWTTSYGGGTNLDGTTASPGGFVPVLTLFSSSGSAVANSGAPGACLGPARVDSSTGICDDAYINATLTPGSYVLDLTEFPNVAIGSLSDGFLFSSDPAATGDTCGGAATGTMFREADLPTCPQRADTYAFNVTNVPEPATVWLLLPAVLLIGVFRGRRHGFLNR